MCSDRSQEFRGIKDGGIQPENNFGYAGYFSKQVNMFEMLILLAAEPLCRRLLNDNHKQSNPY